MERSQEIFSCPEIIEHSGQYLLLRTYILQKIVVGGRPAHAEQVYLQRCFANAYLSGLDYVCMRLRNRLQTDLLSRSGTKSEGVLMYYYVRN